MRKRTSEIWAYFTDEGESRARCTFCSKSLSFKSGSAHNLSRHLRCVHANITLKSNNKEIIMTNEIMQFKQEVEEDEPGTNDVDEDFQQPSTSRQITDAGVSGRNLKQTEFVSFMEKPLSDRKNKEINFSLVKTIAKNYLPFQLVESPYFQEFVKELNSSYTLPNRNSISDTLVPQLYEIVRERVKNRISKPTSFSVTTDGWTSTANESYISVTVHYIEDNKLVSNLLDCIVYSDEHTAQNLSMEIIRIVSEWGIKDKIACVVTDNAANVKAAVRLTGYKHIPCFAHTLNLIVQGGITEISAIHKKVKSVVEFFKRSPQATEKLKQKQEQLGMPILTLKEDVITRWNSTFVMFRRIINIQESLITTISLHYPHLDEISHSDFITIRQFCDILEVFKNVTEEMSSEQNVNVSKIILIVNGLLKYCENYLLKEDLFPSSRQLCKKLIRNVKNRFSDVEENEQYAAATLLDPRFKQHGFSNIDNFNSIKIKIEAELSTILGESTSTVPSQSVVVSSESSSGGNGTTVWDLFDSNISSILYSRDKESISHEELNKYIDQPLLPRFENPLIWWKDRQSIYPNLFNIAMSKLCTMSTSVPCERVFSKAGQTVTDSRNRLKGKNVAQLLFLTYNA